MCVRTTSLLSPVETVADGCNKHFQRTKYHASCCRGVKEVGQIKNQACVCESDILMSSRAHPYEEVAYEVYKVEPF